MASTAADHHDAPAQQPAAGLSQGALLITSGQGITADDVAHQMQAGPGKAKKLFKEMQQLYGAKPTFLHLALFSGATDLQTMMQGLAEARRQRQAKR